MDQLIGLPPGGVLSIVIGIACLATVFLLYVKLQGLLTAVLHGSDTERNALADVLSRLASQMEQLVQLQRETVALLKELPAAPSVASSEDAVYEEQRDPADARIQLEAAQLALDDSAAKALRRRQQAEAASMEPAAGAALGAAAVLADSAARDAFADLSFEQVEQDTASAAPQTEPAPELWDESAAVAPWFLAATAADEESGGAAVDAPALSDSYAEPAQAVPQAGSQAGSQAVSQPAAAESATAESLWDDDAEGFSTRLGDEFAEQEDEFDQMGPASPDVEILEDDIWEQAPESLGNTMTRSAAGVPAGFPAEDELVFEEDAAADSMAFEDTTFFSEQFQLSLESAAREQDHPAGLPDDDLQLDSALSDTPLAQDPGQAAAPEYDELEHEFVDFVDDEEAGEGDASHSALDAALLEALPDDLGAELAMEFDQAPDTLQDSLSEAIETEDLAADLLAPEPDAMEGIADEADPAAGNDPDLRTWEFGDGDAAGLHTAEEAEAGDAASIAPPSAADLQVESAAGPAYRSVALQREVSYEDMQAADLGASADTPGLVMDFDLDLPAEPDADDETEAPHDGHASIMARLMEDASPNQTVLVDAVQLASGVPGARAPEARVLDDILNDAAEGGLGLSAKAAPTAFGGGDLGEDLDAELDDELAAAFDDEIAFEVEPTPEQEASRQGAPLGASAAMDGAAFVAEEDGELLLEFGTAAAPAHAAPDDAAVAAAMTVALEDADLLFEEPGPAPSPAGTRQEQIGIAADSALEDDLLFLDDEESFTPPSAAGELEVDFGAVSFDTSPGESNAAGPIGPAGPISDSPAGGALEFEDDELVFVDDAPLLDSQASLGEGSAEGDAPLELFDTSELLEFEPEFQEGSGGSPSPASTLRGEPMGTSRTAGSSLFDDELDELVSFEPTIMPDPDRARPVHFEDQLERDIAALEDMITFEDEPASSASRPAERSGRGSLSRTNSNITDFILDD
ncbi:hypothetical protein JCM14635_38270 [Megalodesulfovibrio paquesii]